MVIIVLYINVEMCFDPRPYEPVRLEFHAAKLFIGQDIRGTDKSFINLQRAYQIAILAKGKYFQDESFFHTFEYYDQNNKVSLNGRSQIITLELAKLDKVVEKPTEEMSVSERWAVFFGYLTDRSKRGKINEILETEEGIAMAGQVLIQVSKDEEGRARIMRDEKIELDYHSDMVEAKREGLRQGHKEEKQIIARNLLAEGSTPDFVQKITGLSLDEIAKL
jgi:predicted transposase/invertase (TIGR01784 family)